MQATKNPSVSTGYAFSSVAFSSVEAIFSRRFLRRVGHGGFRDFFRGALAPGCHFCTQEIVDLIEGVLITIVPEKISYQGLSKALFPWSVAFWVLTLNSHWVLPLNFVAA